MCLRRIALMRMWGRGEEGVMLYGDYKRISPVLSGEI